MKMINPAVRYRKRTYQLEVCLPCLWPLDSYAWNVINDIEHRTIQVIDPNDRDAHECLLDSDGAYLVDSDAKLTVPLEDWLAVGCQRIRWERPGEDMPDDVVGTYSSNVDITFGTPYDESKPLGPSVFVGEIILPTKIQRAFNSYFEEALPKNLVNAFQFILAHELVHVFDILKYLAAAFMNWRAFRRNILGEGGSTDLVYSRMSDKTMFIDNYGQQNELDRIRRCWPSRAEDWFQTRELSWEQLFPNEK